LARDDYFASRKKKKLWHHIAALGEEGNRTDHDRKEKGKKENDQDTYYTVMEIHKVFPRRGLWTVNQASTVPILRARTRISKAAL